MQVVIFNDVSARYLIPLTAFFRVSIESLLWASDRLGYLCLLSHCGSQHDKIKQQVPGRRGKTALNGPK